ncbi:MAG: exonuclease SbcCD subunit D, partial [Candidatus Bipolaricaulia bacterium]
MPTLPPWVILQLMKILHTADTHIGTRQYGLAERRADFSQALLQVVELACAEGVRAVIHSGDLFDNRNPSTEDLRDVLQGLLRLREAGIPFLAVVGNHEQKR